MSAPSETSTRPTYYRLPVEDRGPRRSPLSARNLVRVGLLSLEAGVTLTLVLAALTR